MTAAAKSSGHWAGFNEVSFVAGMRLLFWICRVFGRWPFRVVLYPVLLWYVLSKPRARRVSRAYLRRVAACGGAADASLPGVLRHFGAFAETILDKMLLWGGLFDTSTVSLHGAGLDGIERCLDEGRGALLICAHLGNLELCRVLSLRRAGLKLTVLVHTRHAQAFNRMLARLNPDSQLNLLQVTEMTPATAMLLAEKVAQGEFVVIAGDRVPVSPQPRVRSRRSWRAGRVPDRPVRAGQRAAMPGLPAVFDAPRPAFGSAFRAVPRVAAPAAQGARNDVGRTGRRLCGTAAAPLPARAARMVQFLRFLATPRYFTTGYFRCISLT